MKRSMSDRLKELLAETGMSQKELANKAEVTESAMSHYVNGTRTPRASVLARIAAALGSTTDYLMGGNVEDAENEICYARKLIARNVTQMTKEEKIEIINILMEGR